MDYRLAFCCEEYTGAFSTTYVCEQDLLCFELNLKHVLEFDNVFQTEPNITRWFVIKTFIYLYCCTLHNKVI